MITPHRTLGPDGGGRRHRSRPVHEPCHGVAPEAWRHGRGRRCAHGTGHGRPRHLNRARNAGGDSKGRHGQMPREARASYDANIKARNDLELEQSRSTDQYLYSVGAISQDTSTRSKQVPRPHGGFQCARGWVQDGDAASVSRAYTADKAERRMPCAASVTCTCARAAQASSATVMLRRARLSRRARRLLARRNSHLNVDCTLAGERCGHSQARHGGRVTIDALGADYPQDRLREPLHG